VKKGRKKQKRLVDNRKRLIFAPSESTTLPVEQRTRVELLYTDPRNTFTSDIIALLQKYPTVDPMAMGFIKDWENEPLWR
jgi:hypothetical protein